MFSGFLSKIFGFLGKFWIDLGGRFFVEKIFRDGFVDFKKNVSRFSAGFGKGLIKSLPNPFGKDLTKPLPNPGENHETKIIKSKLLSRKIFSTFFRPPRLIQNFPKNPKIILRKPENNYCNTNPGDS